MNKKDFKVANAIEIQDKTNYIKQLNALVFNVRNWRLDVTVYSIRQAALVSNEINMRRFLRDPVLHARKLCNNKISKKH